MSFISPAWVDEPNGRGTWGVIQTCLVSLFLCIYTAIHLNIRPHQGNKQSLLRRIGASLLASAAPELTFICAVSQWSLARQLRSQLNHFEDIEIDCERCKQNDILEKAQCPHQTTQALESSNDGVHTTDETHGNADEDTHPRRVVRRSGTLSQLESGFGDMTSDSLVQQDLSNATSIRQAVSKSITGKPKEMHLYTMNQAFFIVAGGLAIETKTFRQEPYLTVTPAGAVELARLGLLKPVSEEVIKDKTKADSITKILVCIVQCIARVAQKLPLTLLEIHTLAHVFIALLMYLFWLSKPYNALSPVVLTDSKLVETAALFTLHDQSGKKEVMSARCALKDELDTASVMNAHFVSMTEEGPPMSNKQVSELVSSPNRQRKGGDILTSTNEQAKKKALTAYTINTHSVSENQAMSNVHLQAKSNASITSSSSHDDTSREHKVGTFSSTSEQTPTSMETYPHDQPQVEYQSQDASAHMHEQRPNEPLTSKVYTSTASRDDHANITFTLAQLAIQRLRSVKSHFVYFQAPTNSIQHRSTYLVPHISDFQETPGCTLPRPKVRVEKKKTRFQFFYKALPSQPDASAHLWFQFIFTCYAAFHLSAWNAYFPTTIERWMWRGAGIVIVSYPITWSLIVLFAPLAFLYKRTPSLWAKVISGIVIPSMLVYCLCLAIAIIASRLYFLVEAFASLREPAPRIYETVDWTQF